MELDEMKMRAKRVIPAGEPERPYGIGQMEKSVEDEMLARKAANLLRENFPNKEISNLLVVKWGGKWKSKLAHIKPIDDSGEYGTLIEVNSLLKDSSVPSWMLDVTLLHELVHYFHGFGSNKKQKFRQPHKGKVVDNEIERFGFGELLKKQDKWMEENWESLLKKHFL